MAQQAQVYEVFSWELISYLYLLSLTELEVTTMTQR